ncbi:F/Y rich C-terminus-domain-containing protein [Mycena rebaudengoi]|nr:F/Y rich C-terminus-domain-containing protein [Mycena rebaudengoi]
MVSSAGTRLRIRPVGGDPERSISPDSEPEDTPDNDESGEYSPNQKPSKRARRSSTDTVSPESKAPRRSSRRAPAAPAPAPAASTGPRTRLIQMPKKTTKRPLSPAPVAAPPQQQQQVEAPPPVQENVNGGNAHNEASSSNQPRLAFNPYYPYLGPPMANAPYPYANPYAYYMGAPMPGAPMAYMPPPHYGPPPPQQQRAPDNLAPRAAKPKRLKAHTVTSKSYSIPMVPRDKKGKPMLPLNVGIMTVINLGDVCMREHFHTERYIFPVGYEVTRRYLSTVDPSVEVVYHCTILDGGDGPKFQIIPSDVPDRPVIAGTATGAWSNIVKQANAIRNRQHSNSVSGPDFFGLGQNTIKHLIQELPNADRLRDYVWQHFVEGGPLGGRHAAVIPALPEEYDAALPIGPYYPPRAPVVRGESEHGESRRVSHYPPHIVAQAAAARQGSSQPPPQEQYQQQQQPPQQQEYDGSRVVMPPTPTSAGGSTSYYLPHTQQQTSGGRAVYPAGNNGAAGSNGVNGGGGSTFASIMNAFPTQDEGGPGPES